MSGQQPGPRQSAFGNAGPFGNQSHFGAAGGFGSQGFPQQPGQYGQPSQHGQSGQYGQQGQYWQQGQYGQAPGSAFGQQFPSSGANPFAVGPTQQGTPMPPGSLGPVQTGPMPYPMVQPKRRLHPVALFGLVGGVGVLVVIAVLVGVAVGTGGGPVAAPPVTAPTTAVVTTPPTTAAPTDTTPPTTPPPTTEPPTTEPPTTEPPTTEPPSSEPSTSAPPKDKPAGPYGDHPEIFDHPINDLQLGEWGCGLTELDAPYGDEFEPWLESVLDCAMDFWTDPVEETGATLTRPRYFYYSGTIQTPCGEINGGMYYCGSEESEGIYIDVDAFHDYSAMVRLARLYVLFHEVGHHVQARVSLFQAYGLGLEPEIVTSRRIEQQATCWGVLQLMTMREVAWTKTDADEFRDWFYSVGDDVHGSGETYKYWLERNLEQQTMAACNTWTADKKHLT